MRKADPDLKDRRRAEILHAATSCFMERGFHQTSMQVIARAMGMSLGLLYRYFASKEEIIDAVAEIEHFGILRAIQSLPDEGQVTKAWEALVIEAATQISEPNTANLVHEVLAEAGRNPQMIGKIQAQDDEALTHIIQKLRLHQAKSALPASINPELAAQQLMALIEGCAARKFVTSPEKDFPLEALAKASVRQILHSN